MDGKLLVLCGERPTINKYGARIDENGNMLLERNGKYIDINEKELEVDIHKKIISGIDLLDDMMTESTEPDILFVDWESIITSDIGPLKEMIKYAQTTEKIPPQLILDSEKNPSLMKKAHINRLLQIDKSNERPSYDYGCLAMEDFMQLFSKTIEKNGIVSILLTFPNQENSKINQARYRIMQSWKNRNEMKAKLKREEKVDILQPMNYDSFGEIYIRAHEEMLKIMSKPDWYEKNNQDEELGGRD